jgi:predicted RecB family nuclease
MPPLHELLEPIEPGKGLASLPPPSGGDLLFDIEGDPYAFDDGLDYLFGVMEANQTDAGGQPRFRAFWSREDDGEFSLAAEKRAFEQLIDFFMERLAADPSLHIYHYASYEPTALKRLMGRHATREDEVDRLLRGGVQIDQ